MPDTNQKTILLVEDEVLLSMNQKSTLERLGYSVTAVYTGETAIEICQNDKFDLILMDIDLGRGMDGTIAAEVILKQFDIPIVFLSSHTSPEIVERTEKITSYGYVVKNTGITVLDASLKMAFKLFKEKMNVSEKQKELEESRSKYRGLSEAAFEAIFISENGLCIEQNQVAEKMFGYTSEEAIGRPGTDWIVAEDRDMVMKKMLTGYEEPYEAIAVRKDGTRFPCLLRGKMMHYKGRIVRVTSLSDISDRKEVENALRQNQTQLQESEGKLKALTENIADTIIQSDKAGNILFVNRLEKGLTLEQVLSATVFDFVPPEQKPIVKKALDAVFEEGKTTLYESIGPGSDNEIKTYEVKVSPIFTGDKITTAVFLARDITARKWAEEEIKQQLKEKEILLKEVHHRIKNNISSIESLLSLQIQSTTNSEAKTIIKASINRVQSMRVLYENLLKGEKYYESSVKTYIESLIDSIAAIIPDHMNVKIEKQIIDFNLISKNLFPLGIIINELLTNILKYAFIGKQSGNVIITLGKVENHVSLIIQDNGIGLPEGFDLNTSTGLGLLLVQMLTKQLKGTYSIESNGGTKSTLLFNF